MLISFTMSFCLSICSNSLWLEINNIKICPRAFSAEGLSGHSLRSDSGLVPELLYTFPNILYGFMVVPALQ
jgi:hypothetical protein